ncbi:DUF3592 domain-containing protein [Lacipirellula sp.]|uniref:DUF3592 domain-containing protein n=1 Tax=Lacipirellula sp. TaxID=2691419 RepID=UPI003D0F27B3
MGDDAHDDDAAKEQTLGSFWSDTGCLIIFAIPFLAIGVGGMASAASDVWEWSEVQRWTERPATIEHAKLGVDTEGDGDATFKATATYRYTVDGESYSSDRVALYEGFDTFGSFQRDRAAELDAALEAGGAFRCFVDPDDPRHAVLFRDLRTGLLAFKAIMGLLFASLGGGMMGAAIRSKKIG